MPTPVCVLLRKCYLFPVKHFKWLLVNHRKSYILKANQSYSARLFSCVTILEFLWILRSMARLQTWSVEMFWKILLTDIVSAKHHQNMRAIEVCAETRYPFSVGAKKKKENEAQQYYYCMAATSQTQKKPKTFACLAPIINCDRFISRLTWNFHLFPWQNIKGNHWRKRSSLHTKGNEHPIIHWFSFSCPVWGINMRQQHPVVLIFHNGIEPPNILKQRSTAVWHMLLPEPPWGRKIEKKLSIIFFANMRHF